MRDAQSRQQKRPGKPDLPLIALSSASTSVVKAYANSASRALLGTSALPMTSIYRTIVFRR